MKTSLRIFLFTFLAGLVLFTGTTPATARIQASGTSQATTNTDKKSDPKTAPTSQEIADANAKGLVWVNTSTHVYHKNSSSLYGTTKHGKFMTEDDAKKAGYRAAQESGSGKKPSGGTSPASK